MDSQSVTTPHYYPNPSKFQAGLIHSFFFFLHSSCPVNQHAAHLKATKYSQPLEGAQAPAQVNLPLCSLNSKKVDQKKNNDHILKLVWQITALFGPIVSSTHFISVQD